eukprot:3214808-Karenia_brevis.AAC.1
MHSEFQAKKRKGATGEAAPAGHCEGKEEEQKAEVDEHDQPPKSAEQLNKKLEEQAARKAAKEEEIKNRPK